MTLDEILALLELRARGLRDAGVVGAVAVETPAVTVRFELAAPGQGKPPRVEFPGMDDAPNRGAAAAEQRVEMNALDDPETFGGKLPGYQVPMTVPMPVEDER